MRNQDHRPLYFNFFSHIMIKNCFFGTLSLVLINIFLYRSISRAMYSSDESHFSMRNVGHTWPQINIAHLKL